MTNDEKQVARQELIAMLMAQQTFSLHDVLNKYATGGSVAEEREARLLLWEAMENVRNNHNIDFGPMKAGPATPAGTYERKTWEQVARRSNRQRAAAIRKQQRAHTKMMLAAILAPGDAKERLQRSADWQATKIAFERTRSRNLPGLED
jgi:hypothetical protein